MAGRRLQQRDHLAALIEHAPDLAPAVVLADAGCVGDDAAALEQTVASYGARLVLADVMADDGTPRHDPAKLAVVYAHIMSGD